MHIETRVKPLGPSPGASALHAPWLAARVAAGLSLLAGWVHLAYMSSHFADWWAYGLFFLAVGAGQAVFAPAILYRPSRWLVIVGLVGNAAVVTMYVVTRTSGVPMGPHEGVVEHAAPIDLATTAVEVALIGLLLVMLGPRVRRWAVNVLLLIGVVFWSQRLLGLGPLV